MVMLLLTYVPLTHPSSLSPLVSPCFSHDHLFLSVNIIWWSSWWRYRGSGWRFCINILFSGMSLDERKRGEMRKRRTGRRRNVSHPRKRTHLALFEHHSESLIQMIIPMILLLILMGMTPMMISSFSGDSSFFHFVFLTMISFYFQLLALSLSSLSPLPFIEAFTPSSSSSHQVFVLKDGNGWKWIVCNPSIPCSIRYTITTPSILLSSSHLIKVRLAWNFSNSTSMKQLVEHFLPSPFVPSIHSFHSSLPFHSFPHSTSSSNEMKAKREKMKEERKETSKKREDKVHFAVMDTWKNKTCNFFDSLFSSGLRYKFLSEFYSSSAPGVGAHCISHQRRILISIPSGFFPPLLINILLLIILAYPHHDHHPASPFLILSVLFCFVSHQMIREGNKRLSSDRRK